MVDLTAAWRNVFASWPPTLPRTGLLVLAGQETVPFVDFLLGESFVVVERDKPDAQGARKLIVALAAITAVKLTTAEELSSLQGFTATAEPDFASLPSYPSRGSAGRFPSDPPPRRL